MPRSLPALVLAAAAGAAVTYFLVAPPRSAEIVSTPQGNGSAGDAPSVSARSAAVAGVAERAAVYATAARADARELTRLAREAAAAPPSPVRSFSLGVLLARYAELDPARAIALGRELRVPADVLGTLYADWARSDPARARAALAEVDDPVAATTIGLAMFAALGGDEAALRQVTAELPPGAERAFLVGAVAAVAQTDPKLALDQALELSDPGLTGLALQEIASAWARSDIAAALEAGDGIADADLRATFQNAVLREWAQFDLDAVFAYYLDLDAESQEELATLGALAVVARLDPYRALDLSAQLSGALRIGVEQAALQSLAQRDPEVALQYVTRLPPGQQQQVVRQTLARAYGKKNPEAALAWARGSGTRENLYGVLAGVAITNPQLAFEVLATLPAAERGQAAQSLIQGAMGDRSTNFTAIADGLLAFDASTDPAFAPRNNLGIVLASWASRSLSSALDWTMANGERVPPGAFSSIAASVARNDLATAEQYLAQVPAQARVAWFRGMAQNYSQTDPAAAAVWVERFRTEPGYPTAVAQIATSLARFDPVAAAAVLDRIDESSMPGGISGAAASVGRAWARTDAPAAAEWARRFPTDVNGQMALRGVVEVWAGSDTAAARGWTLRLPAGTVRDEALSALVARADTIDAGLLAAFSADAARQTAVVGAIYRIAQRSPADARRAVERYVTLPEQRQRAERGIELVEREQGGNLGFIITN